MHEKVLEILREDHREILMACRQLLQAESPGERKALVNKVHQVMLPHLIAEEETFYTAWAGRGHAQEAVEPLEEHQEIRMILDQLIETEVETPGYGSEVGRLCEAIDCHLQEEEEKMFAQFRLVATEEEAVAILARFREEKEKIWRQIAREVIIPSEMA